MTSTNIQNLNTSNIYAITNINDLLSNITINNSMKIQKSSITTYDKLNNINAGFLLKDINSNNSGSFYRIHTSTGPTNTTSGVPVLYFNYNPIIDTSNLLAELEYILQFHPLETSNLIVNNGYINFTNGSNPNPNQGETGVGFRYNSNNMIQFKNYDTDWIDLVDIIHHDEFKELKDVDVYTNPLENNQYIIYNSSNQKFVNKQLDISDDPNPTLGGDLEAGDYIFKFSGEETRFVYNSNGIIDNNLLVLKNNTSMTNDYNYIELNNADISGHTNVAIIARSTYDSNVGIDIDVLRAGNINLNAIQGNVYVNATNLIVSGSMSVSSIDITGFTKSSIYRTSSNIGYTPNTYWDIPITTDTILFNFNDTSSNGSYFANVGVGVDGQKLNLIFNTSISNIDVKVFFGTNKLIVGSGLANGMGFDTSGQSSSLLYLGYGIDAWQALNTGAILF